MPMATTKSPATLWPNSDHAVISAVRGAFGSLRSEAAASSASVGLESRGHFGGKTTARVSLPGARSLVDVAVLPPGPPCFPEAAAGGGGADRGREQDRHDRHPSFHLEAPAHQQ